MSNRLFYDRGGGGYGRAWAQRWLCGHQTWAVPGPRLDPSRYGVAHVTEPAARAFSTRHHYLTSWVASTRRRYGLFDITATPAQLVGTAVMAIPPNKLVLTNTFPTLEPYEESLVLARLVLLDEVPWSAESWFMGEVCRLAAADGLRGVVMDSDPVPRYRPDGHGGMEKYTPGHVGTVYQAMSFRYFGTTNPQSQWLLPSGLIVSRRSLQKVRAGSKATATSRRSWFSTAPTQCRTGKTPGPGCTAPSTLPAPGQHSTPAITGTPPRWAPAASGATC